MAELDRRVADLVSGKTKTIPWSEVKAKLATKSKQKSKAATTTNPKR